MFNNFNSLCAPAKLYFALVIISIIIGLFSGFHLLAIILKLIFAFIWTVVLNWFCKKGWKILSWVLVLLPFVVIIFAYIGMMAMRKQKDIKMNGGMRFNLTSN